MTKRGMNENGKKRESSAVRREDGEEVGRRREEERWRETDVEKMGRESQRASQARG